MATQPPGPRGEYLAKLNYEFWRADPFGFLTTLVEHYGNVVGFDLGCSHYILVNGVEQVRELFSEHEDCLHKPEFVKRSNRGHWGDGLTTLEESSWQKRRRVVRSGFGPKAVSAFMDVVIECTEDMLDAWHPDRRLDLAKELRVLTARIAAQIVLDAELEGYGPAQGRSGVLPFAEAYGEDFVSAPGGDPKAPMIIERPRAPRRMDAATRIIDERIATRKDRGDILSQLVRARLPDGERLSRDEIIGEVMQMLHAGHLTIPSTLMHLWRDIADSDVATRIAAEADQLFVAGFLSSPAMLESYCFATIKESMRLHPPAPILHREVKRGFELNGFEFVRNVTVWVSPQLLHNDSRNYPEPNRFLPERFLTGSQAGTRQPPYFPFGAGRRKCVASHLALCQTTLITLLTARRFRLALTLDEREFRIQPRGSNNG